MRLKPVILRPAAALAVIALVLGCGRGGSAPAASHAPTGAKPARLRIANYAFTPRALTVRAGTTITVTNTDSTAHTATASSGVFDSGTLKPGQSGRITLKAPGTYTYICQFHAFMTGTIKVVR